MHVGLQHQLHTGLIQNQPPINQPPVLLYIYIFILYIFIIYIYIEYILIIVSTSHNY